MTTPEAEKAADELRREPLSPRGHYHQVALALDRFAAQRGAEQKAALAVVPEYPKQSYMTHFGERARALIFDLTMAFPGLLKFWSLTQVEAAILPTLTRALRSSYREGAEAMQNALRGACDDKPNWSREMRVAADIIRGRMKAAADIFLARMGGPPDTGE